MNEVESLAPVVFVLDDDESVRAAVAGLLSTLDLSVYTFGSVESFLEFPPPNRPNCLVLDIELDGDDGLSLQLDLVKTRLEMPIIFITGHANVDRSVQAFKGGAIEFLTKPFSSEALIDAVQSALRKSELFLKVRAELAPLSERYATLTPRERQVMQLVVSGLLNKQIAAQFSTREITIKVHRGKVMRKMGAGSLAELVRMADKLGIEPTPLK